MPDVVLCQELLHVHDGIIHLLFPLTLLGDGDCDDGDLLVIICNNNVFHDLSRVFLSLKVN